MYKTIPAPGKYEPKIGEKKVRIIGNYKQSDNPVFFTDAAKKAAKQVPA